MSKDKHRSLARRKALLGHRIMLAHEGGMDPKNPDLVRLINEGLMSVERNRYPGGPRFPPPKKFRTQLLGSIHGSAPRSWAVLTPLGEAALKSGKYK